MQVTVLAGGIGAARFLRGLVGALRSTPQAPRISVIGNTGDDITLFGLHVSPDLDSVMYTLGGAADKERGWGRAEESFTILEELKGYGALPDWFGLGDKDFATHIWRTHLLNAGYTLAEVTEALAKRWELPIRLLPVTNDRVETHVATNDPDTGQPVAMHFQEWWVRYQAQLPAEKFIFVGVEDAKPAPGVLAAIAEADVIIFSPSNPVVSIQPIIDIPGVRDALIATKAPIVGISPIVGGKPVRGMADKCLEVIGVEPTAEAVAKFYGARSRGGLLDGWIVDHADDALVEPIHDAGFHCIAADTIFTHVSNARHVAELAIDLGWRFRKDAQ